MNLVTIDPGHGGSDPGAVNREAGVLEKTINLEVARKLRSILIEPGNEIIPRLTRNRDVSASLKARADFANALALSFPEAHTVFLSLHCNSFTEPDVRGVEVWHFPGSAKSSRLAQSILDAVCRGFPELYSRGLKSGPELYVLRETSMPAALLEMEFISNPSACLLAASADFQWRMAQCAAAGIKAYFSEL